jgi:DNA (cytosine-5)-methyltransferase 1
MNTIALKNNAPNHKTLVSLFAGCGGSSLGYKAIGFDIRLAVEWDKGAASIYRDNFPETTLHEGDINKMDVSEALRLTELKQGELDVLDGSPPCQGFSGAGKRQFSDKRNELFHEYVRLLQGMMPKVFIMENVSGLVRGKMKILFSEMTRALQASGYRVACRQLNAWWYGVPQSRERLIWIGIRDDIEGEPSHPQPMLRKPISVRQALGIKGITSSWRGDIKQALLNDKWKDTTLPSPTLTGSQAPLVLIASGYIYPQNAIANGQSINKPSQTLVAYRPPTLIEGTSTRDITIGEAKVLQGFPSWFRIQQYKYLGNSVPPLMAQAVGEHVAGILDGADAN